MDNSLLANTYDQLKFVNDLLGNAVESVETSPILKGLALARERVTLVQELFSAIWQEFAGLKNQNEELLRLIKSDADSEARRHASKEKEVSSPSRTERYHPLDQGLLDNFCNLAVKYGQLRRETALLRGNVESIVRHVDDFWTGDDETKKFVLQKLHVALSTKISSDS